MITLTVSSIAVDIKGKKYILVGLLPNVPAVHKHKVPPKVEEMTLRSTVRNDVMCHL